MNTQNLMTAHSQWASRPDDERYLSLEELYQAVSVRREESWTVARASNDLRVMPSEVGDTLLMGVYDPTTDKESWLLPSHYSFGQLCQYANAPAKFLRTLPPELAAINLQWKLENDPMREDVLVLAQTNEEDNLRSLTSPSYGRIWDKQVVQAVMNVNRNGDWKIPAASYAMSNPKRATTLYASDRDVFMFLVDPDHPIEVNGTTLYRGFITWNSEVGSAVFGLTTFLYNRVCDNRIIWGATDVKELRIRHTGGAPERFSYEGERYLRKYANERTQPIIDGVIKAQDTEIPLKKDQTVAEWLQDRGFTKDKAESSVKSAKAEEGEARTIWQIVQGITAHARSIPHTNDRVALETKAGQLMKFATKDE